MAVLVDASTPAATTWENSPTNTHATLSMAMPFAAIDVP